MSRHIQVGAKTMDACNITPLESADIDNLMLKNAEF